MSYYRVAIIFLRRDYHSMVCLISATYMLKLNAKNTRVLIAGDQEDDANNLEVSHLKILNLVFRTAAFYMAIALGVNTPAMEIILSMGDRELFLLQN